MSYILDALRKAEAEKAEEARANPVLNQQTKQHHWSLYVIAVALIGNLTVLIWLFGPWDQTPAGRSEAAVPTANLQIESAANPSVPERVDSAVQQAGPQTSETSEAAAQLARPRTADSQPAPVQRSTAAREPVHTTLAGLDSNVRARFPDISFSTHVYAADPDLRAVVVNGERLREGDRLGELQLTNITETGVVFRFEQYFVSVSVLEDWD